METNFKLPASISLLLIGFVLVFASCGGGGGGGGGAGEVTVRPKTMDGVTLNLPGGTVSFEFIRSSASGQAVAIGDVETGTFIYNYGFHTAQYNSVEGFFIDVIWPFSLANATYTYTPINDTSGELVLSADSFFFDADSGAPIGVNSALDHNYFSNVTTPSTVRMIVSFTESGGFIPTADIRMEDPERPSATDPGGFAFDTTTFVTTSLTLNGGQLPTNYSPTDGVLQHSKISLTELGGTNIEFVDDVAPLADNFSVVLTQTAVNTTDFDEIGEAVFRDVAGVVVIAAADYTYDRIIGTDTANLVLTGGTPHDGNVVLTFTSVSSPPAQNAGGTYVTPGGNTGSFTVITP